MQFEDAAHRQPALVRMPGQPLKPIAQRALPEELKIGVRTG